MATLCLQPLTESEFYEIKRIAKATAFCQEPVHGTKSTYSMIATFADGSRIILYHYAHKRQNPYHLSVQVCINQRPNAYHSFQTAL